ncbi:ran-binding protein 3 isoform X1 [Hydra vulgaris]|uniref:Ran-binding protein 3 n=1 Tax=Hydra vulgaris TaxID=6087 RepID=T2M5Y4_HYDVU|nr:ran-binding protein 3 isoform X1 [Hydra vulgaris]
MENEKSDNVAGAGQPFQLRPSKLGSDFSSFIKDAPNRFTLRPSALSAAAENIVLTTKTEKESPSKGFTLRPSALSTAAENIVLTPKAENRKRAISDDSQETDQFEEANKKTKTANQINDSVKSSENNDSVKSSENESTVGNLDIVRHPTGIGTFGFTSSESNIGLDTNSLNKNISDQVPNYFRKGLENGGKKLEFVFGASSNDGITSNAVDGFRTLSNKTQDFNNHNNNVQGQDNHKLLENADQYQKSYLENKKHFEELQQFTGEEGENHVLQVLCKLHEFNSKTKTWQEKGRGTLRLNDITQSDGLFQSRIVFRTQGTNIVLLNTMLWPEMCCEKVREKNVRISGITPDSQEVKLFLLNCGPNDCQKIFTSIERRIVALKRRKEHLSIVKNASNFENSDNDIDSDSSGKQSCTGTNSMLSSSSSSSANSDNQ